MRILQLYPQAAEWLGRYLGVWVLRGMNLPDIVKVYAAVDGAHVTIEGQDLVRSSSPFVDRVPVWYTQQLHVGLAEEVCVPVQGPHRASEAMGTHVLPDLQREAHVLARVAVPHGQNGTTSCHGGGRAHVAKRATEDLIVLN